MNPLIEYALKKVDAAMAEVDKRLDDIEAAILPVVVALDITSMHSLRQINQTIIDALTAELADFDRKATILKKALRAEDDALVELDLWEYRRPIVYKIQRAEDIKTRINSLLRA